MAIGPCDNFTFTLPVFSGNYPARQFASCPRINSAECYVLLTYKRDIKSILIHLANEQPLYKCSVFRVSGRSKKDILSYSDTTALTAEKKCSWRLWAARNFVISSWYTDLAFNGSVVTDQRKPLRCMLRGTPHRVYLVSTDGKSW